MIALPDLNGFDMVYALTEKAINDQFALLWGQGQLPSTWNASSDSGLYSIDAQLGQPSISFNTGDPSGDQAVLLLPILEGNFNYVTIERDNGTPVVKIQPPADISGFTLKITTNMNLAAVAASEKTVAPEVQAQLSKFNEEMFDIQHLFMDLEDVNVLEGCELEPQIDTSPEVLGALNNMIKSYTDSIAASGTPYVLGYSVTNKPDTIQSNDPTWIPTGLSFSPYVDAAYPTRTSLNYLLVTGGKSVPTGGDVFTANWITRDDVDGTFAFSPNLVMNDVVDAIQNVLPSNAGSFSADGRGNLSTTYDNDIGGQTTVTVTPKTQSNQISVPFHVTFKQEAYDKLGSDIGYVAGSTDWVTTLTFTVDAGTDGTGQTISATSASSEQQTTSQQYPNALGKIEDALATIADSIISALSGGSSISGLFESMVALDWDKSLETVTGQPMTSFGTRIIPPAGSQLLFKDCTFEADGTLLLSTTIKN